MWPACPVGPWRETFASNEFFDKTLFDLVRSTAAMIDRMSVASELRPSEAASPGFRVGFVTLHSGVVLLATPTAGWCQHLGSGHVADVLRRVSHVCRADVKARILG
jgi:hypothetical protein